MGNVTGSPVLNASIKTITPQNARDWLDKRIRNRSVSASRVNRYAKAMKSGEWIIGQPLMRNCDGTLIDGQHRLNAVIEAGIPIEFLVIDGYDREQTFGRVDEIRARKLHDWLRIHGEALPEVLAPVV